MCGGNGLSDSLLQDLLLCANSLELSHEMILRNNTCFCIFQGPHSALTEQEQTFLFNRMTAAIDSKTSLACQRVQNARSVLTCHGMKLR